MVTRTELELATRAVPRVRALVRAFGTKGWGDLTDWGHALAWWAAFFTCLRLDQGAEWAEARTQFYPPGHQPHPPDRVRAAAQALVRNGRAPCIRRALGAVTEPYIEQMTDLYVLLRREDVARLTARLTAANEAGQRACAAYEAGGTPDPQDVAALKAADPAPARIPDVLFCALDLLSAERQVDALRKFG